MKFIQPKAELWQQTGTMNEHIARCARVCYKSSNATDADRMCDRLWKNGHRSMFRHGTHYFYVKHVGKLPKWFITHLKATELMGGVQIGHALWCSCNDQYWRENDNVREVLAAYETTEAAIIEYAVKERCPQLVNLLRMTVCVTTQISTTRELNRTSPNNIAEQSTRYVNFGKKGGIGIVRPHWFDDKFSSFLEGVKARLAQALYWHSCKIADITYHLMLKLGLPPQDARGILPLDTHSVAVYTYDITEWEHILDLRLYEKTGKAHPNAKLIAQQIHDVLKQRITDAMTEKKLLPAAQQ